MRTFTRQRRRAASQVFQHAADLPGLRERMGEALAEHGVAERQIRMRVSQLWHWLYVRGVSDFDDMSNVSKDMRDMLKTHFSQSQFVVVSLKEGMFNNANVIFRTKFVDGVSQVTRTIGTGASVRSRALKEKKKAEEAIAPTPRKTAPGSKSRGKENSVF